MPTAVCKYKFSKHHLYTSGKTVSNSKNPGMYSGCIFISSWSHFTIPPPPQSSAGTCTAKAATAMLIYKARYLSIYPLGIIKCDERVSKKLLDNTWVLTFGGPLWNFLNKFCAQNTHEQKTFKICNKTINHSSYKEKGPLHSKKILRWKLRMDTQFSLKLTMDSGYSLTFKESRNGRKASEGSSSKSRCT